MRHQKALRRQSERETYRKQRRKYQRLAARFESLQINGRA